MSQFNLSELYYSIAVNSYLLFQECGELLLGLTYLPTAQRLSFSIVKATNLKYNTVVDNIEEFRK